MYNAITEWELNMLSQSLELYRNEDERKILRLLHNSMAKYGEFDNEEMEVHAFLINKYIYNESGKKD